MGGRARAINNVATTFTSQINGQCLFSFSDGYSTPFKESKEFLEAQEIFRFVGLPSYPSPEEFIIFLKDRDNVEKAWRALKLKEMW